MKGKKFITDIDIFNQKIGFERRQEILDNISYKGTNLPSGVSIEDMDSAVINFFKEDKELAISIEGERVPVVFLTIHRWNEFTKTWSFSDEYETVKMPFITIVRKPDIQQGMNQAGLWNIPGRRTYTYIKVPTLNGGRTGIDVYKIPTPVAVDITYEIKLFTTKLQDLNLYNTMIQLAFQSRQCYINVKGNPMPLHLENIGDESNIEDFENKRFYIQTFEVVLLGYILDESQFEVIPSINRTVMAFEIQENLNIEKGIINTTMRENEVNFNFIFKEHTNTTFNFVIAYDVNFTKLQEIKNISRIIIKINGVSVFDGLQLNTPLIMKANDNITIKVSKSNFNIGEFKLIGLTTTV